MAATGAQKLSSNIRRIGHLDIPGGGQVVVEDGFAYVGHMSPPHGTSIIDVRDPANPRLAARIMLEGGASHSHKARVAGDLMIVNVERDNRHFLRKGDRLAELRAALAARLGRPPQDSELAAEIGVEAGDIPVLDAARERGYGEGGFRLYDVSDKARPRLIHHQPTGGIGVHRFDMDGSHAYISTEMEGYVGNILVVYDLADPARPREVSRWHMPGQHIAAGEVPTWAGERHRLHHALRVGDELWAAVWFAGLRVLDASDITQLREIGSFSYQPPFPEPTHTVLPLSRPIGGRRIAIAIDEEHAKPGGQPHAFMWVLDVTDLSDIRAVSTFHVGESASPWGEGRSGRFGAHQFQEHLDSTLVFATWFAGGLRIIDVANPSVPREVGHFIPEPVAGAAAPQSNDVDVGPDGLIYLLDRVNGFDILEFTP
jgi:hypothetical protein